MSMIERVARQIEIGLAGGAPGGPSIIDHRTGLRLARAAIEAMREPNEAMVAAFWDRHAEAETVFAEPAALYRAMIDTALSSPLEGRESD